MALLIVEARKANNDEGTDRVAVHLPALMFTGDRWPDHRRGRCVDRPRVSPEWARR